MARTTGRTLLDRSGADFGGFRPVGSGQPAETTEVSVDDDKEPGRFETLLQERIALWISLIYCWK